MRVGILAAVLFSSTIGLMPSAIAQHAGQPPSSTTGASPREQGARMPETSSEPVRGMMGMEEMRQGPSPGTSMSQRMGLGLLASGELEFDRSVAQHLANWIVESPVGSDEGRASRLAPAEAVLRCATCHAKSDAHREMFGNDCGACHGTRGWVIPEYRHPASASTDCAQCHHTPHFKRVCATVAGEPNAAVRDCHSCHQVTAWNDIQGVGWYQSH